MHLSKNSIRHLGSVSVLLLHGGLLKGLWMKKRAMTTKQGLLLGLIEEALKYKDEYLNDTNVYCVIDKCIVTDDLNRVMSCVSLYGV